ncbi:MAG: flagellin, partial [Armatimonadota bacterium]|nr:flagellin [Armatimonadota bacterium]
MGLRINQNIAALNAHRNLVATDNALSKSLERLSSGFRINRAADDAAGLAISEKMRAQVRGYTQAIRNAQDGISLVQTAEGALNEVHSILQRIRELVLQAGNETLSAEDRLAIQSEIDQLVEEVDRIANSTNFNGVLLLDGGAGGGPTSVNVVAGPSGGIAETITVSLADVRSSTLGDGTNSLQDVDVTDFSTLTLAQQLGIVDGAIGQVSGSRAGFGAVQNRLEHTVANLGVALENMSAAESRIRDADMAQEMVVFTRNQILLQAGTAMLAQANAAPQVV